MFAKMIQNAYFHNNRNENLERKFNSVGKKFNNGQSVKIIIEKFSYFVHD